MLAPGFDHDEFYNIPSLVDLTDSISSWDYPPEEFWRFLPVFSVPSWKMAMDTRKRSKPMLNTSKWFAALRIDLPTSLSPLRMQSMTQDGLLPMVTILSNRSGWTFDLPQNRLEIIEIPNSAGNHSSPFYGPKNTVVCGAGTRLLGSM